MIQLELPFRFTDRFATNHPQINDVSKEVVKKLRVLRSVRKVGPLQLFLGPPGSGSPLHWHDAALNYLAFGQKRWFLSAPASPIAGYSNTPVLDWLQQTNGFESKDLLQCTQFAGDIVYVPRRWAHGTLNTKTSIGRYFHLAACACRHLKRYHAIRVHEPHVHTHLKFCSQVWPMNFYCVIPMWFNRVTPQAPNPFQSAPGMWEKFERFLEVECVTQHGSELPVQSFNSTASTQQITSGLGCTTEST